MTKERTTFSLLAVMGPGLLVAATGVGAGDLATASFTGIQLGVGVLWAVVLGAFLKYVITEGLARWQLATGTTLLEGCSEHLGRPFQVAFLLYLIPWSFFVGGALMSACGVTAHAIAPLFGDGDVDKQVYGVIQSGVAVGLVLLGGYRLFEYVMRVCIGVMFVTVVVTAVLVRPDWAAVTQGIFVPVIPQMDGQGVQWTIALMGGIGGTLTVLCYGYWIREEGREGASALSTCRIDLAAGYIMTAVFGMAMVIIGSQMTVEGSGVKLVVNLAEQLGGALGPVGYWAFLLGAWGAVFSSMLGVWQCVPYVFADFVAIVRNVAPKDRSDHVSSRSKSYRGYLAFLAVVPIAGLFVDFRDIQKYYAIIGAAFMPFMAFVLLYLNGSGERVGAAFKNRAMTTVVLIGAILFFALAGWYEIQKKFGLG
jgi:Mn2+/Fe2+ NRAMP family transporter